MIPALLNQIKMLSSLKGQVEARAGELSRLNDTSSPVRVETQVSEKDRLLLRHAIILRCEAFLTSSASCPPEALPRARGRRS